MEDLERKVALIEQDAKGLGPDTIKARRGLVSSWVDVINAIVSDASIPDVDFRRLIEPGTIKIVEPVFKNNVRLKGRFIDGINGEGLIRSGFLELWGEDHADDKVSVESKNINGFSIDGLRHDLTDDELVVPHTDEIPNVKLWLPSDMRAATWTDSDGIMPEHPSNNEISKISMKMCRGLPAPIISCPTVDSVICLILAPKEVVGNSNDDLDKRMSLCWPGFHDLLNTVLSSYGKSTQTGFESSFEILNLSEQVTMSLDGSSGDLVTVGVKIYPKNVIDKHHMVKTYQMLSKMLDELLFTITYKIGESYSFTRVVPIMSGTGVLNHALTDPIDDVPSVDVHTITVDDEGNVNTFYSEDTGDAPSITGEMMDSITRLVKSVEDSVETMRGDASKIKVMIKSGVVSTQLALTLNPLVNDVEDTAEKISNDLGTLRSIDSYKSKVIGGSTIESIRAELVTLKDLQARAADYEANSRVLLRTVQGWSPLPGDAAITLAKSINRLREIEGSRPIGYDSNRDG